MKIHVKYFISVCFILLLFFMSSLIFFNVYAQQGGSAIGGSVIGGPTVGGYANCYGPCFFYGPPTIGGSATGGNANNNPSRNLPNITTSTIQLNNNLSNKAPIANASSLQEVNPGYIVLLNGSKSYDPDGNPISFSWRQIAGPAVKLNDDTSDTPLFTAPNVSTYTKLVFELIVKDNKGAKGYSIVTIIDKPNKGGNAISFDSGQDGSATISKDNGSYANTTQQINATGVPTNDLIYTNSKYGISISYPHNWSIIDSAEIQDLDVDIVRFLSPNQEDNAIVEVHQDKKGNSIRDIGAYLISLSSLYKNNIKDFKVIESNTNAFLAENKAYKLVFTYSTGDGFRMKDMEIGTLIGNKVYYIIYDGRESVFDNYTPVVQSMANSLQIDNSHGNNGFQKQQ